MEPQTSSNDIDEDSIYFKLTTAIKSDVIKETLKLRYGDTKTKISEEALELVKEIGKVMVVEAAIRAAKQASMENKSTVTVNHVETILPQLILDFS